MNFKTNKTKLIARVLVLVLLVTLVLTLTSCGEMYYDWEVYSHEEWIEYIQNYNGVHDFYVNTYISFDLDDNDQISKRIYYFGTMVSSPAVNYYRNHGYLCDLYTDDLGSAFLFYLKSDGQDTDEFAYKIKCICTSVDFNYTKNDKIEILKSECSNDSAFCDPSYDLKYEDSLMSNEEVSLYNHAYHYSLYANDAKVCCIHISSIDEASEEKLNEIIQMLSDSLVVINTEEFFIWRD